MAEYSKIQYLGRQLFFEKNDVKIFHCTNQLEMVYGGANLPLKVNFEEEISLKNADFNCTQSPFCIPNSMNFNNKTCPLHLFTDVT